MCPSVGKSLIPFSGCKMSESPLPELSRIQLLSHCSPHSLSPKHLEDIECFVSAPTAEQENCLTLQNGVESDETCIICDYELLLCLNGGWNSLWADTSHSFHTMPGYSAPDRCSSSGSQQSRTPWWSFLMSKMKGDIGDEHRTELFLCWYVWSKVKQHVKITLRVLFRVVHGEEQREGRADSLLTTATQAAILYLTSKQLSNCWLTRGAQRAGTNEALKQNNSV